MRCKLAGNIRIRIVSVPFSVGANGGWGIHIVQTVGLVVKLEAVKSLGCLLLPPFPVPVLGKTRGTFFAFETNVEPAPFALDPLHVEFHVWQETHC